jgi:hypothetical protein
MMIWKNLLLYWMSSRSSEKLRVNWTLTTDNVSWLNFWCPATLVYSHFRWTILCNLIHSLS